ncbi:hypothetical protein [Tropicimonas sp. IMCC34043]|uniref:hypothetical protein n=1 Tax=Tropicimonas sp. IMCC34043 TaxID=2248760 RepID=UPI000E284845|nr:hypothetical protein [Tropicimonas sp. IMCC34043]
MRTAPPLFCLLLVAISPGCARFPQLDAKLTETGRQAPSPVLTDIRPILAGAPKVTANETETDMIERADALRASAAVISLPVMTEDERTQLASARGLGPDADAAAIDAAERARLEDAHARLRGIADAAATGDAAASDAAAATDPTAPADEGDQQRLEDAAARLRKLMQDAQTGVVAPDP